jgi:uncharacterized protein (DUF2252 family)
LRDELGEADYTARRMRTAMARWLAAATLLSTASCAEVGDDARAALVVSTTLDADEAMLVDRPALVAGKHARMGRDLYAFYRGSMPLFLRDARTPGAPLATTRFALDQPLVLSMGDPHPENFGVLWAADGTAALEPNDFDAADRAPYLRDVRRLVAGMAVAAQVANVGDVAAQTQTRAAARTIARATALGYAQAIEALAAGQAPTRVVDAQGSAVLADLFARAAKDRGKRKELAPGGPTVLTGSTRTLVRGAPDPADPESFQAELPAWAARALPATIADYRRTLVAPTDPSFFTILDAVRVFGSGVASWPKIRALVLVRGPTDDPGDDVLLELKELTDSGNAAWLLPGVSFDTVGARVLATTRAAWARPDADPLWGTASWAGLPVQIKSESEAFKTMRTSKLTGALGTPDELAKLGAALGALLARVHATPLGREASPAAAIAARFAGDLDGFADEQADVGASYAALANEDWARFRSAIFAHGYLLGREVEPNGLSPDFAALIGAPPSIVPLPP